MRLRPLELPPGVKGKIYLTSMPGRAGDYISDRAQIEQVGVDTVLCLSPMDEVESRSRDYAGAIKSHLVHWKQVMLPMEDFGTSNDRDAWLAEITSLARHVNEGGVLMVHCYAGIGRTGTAATCLLMALGLRRSDAMRTVYMAGSNPEDPRQRQLIDWAAELYGLR